MQVAGVRVRTVLRASMKSQSLQAPREPDGKGREPGAAPAGPFPVAVLDQEDGQVRPRGPPWSHNLRY